MQEQRGASFVDEPIDTSPAEKRKGNEALPLAVSAGSNQGEGVSCLARVLSSYQVSPEGAGRAIAHDATVAVNAISCLSLEHISGGLGASRVGEEGDS
jgi:hypothetical protein